LLQGRHQGAQGILHRARLNTLKVTLKQCTGSSNRVTPVL
jgi:hypothetical protein